ncbi:MAG: glycosyltransferase family 9 protein [Actinomycetota bacterium]|nr:glycosyltransferase family 9 protein [Actinomycetota bacterium]
MSRLVPDVERIAVLRANALGDLMFALPALDALRAAYPDAELVLLGRAWHRDLLDGRPGPVDRTVVVPPFEGPLGPDERRALDQVLDELAGEGVDLALQLHGGGRNSNPVVRRLGARVVAGLRTPDAEPLDREVPYVYYQHEVLRLLEVVGLVGATPRTLEPRFALAERDRAEAAAVDGETPLVALHPGATDPRRRWPPERFAAVGDALAAAGASVVVTGSDGERQLVAAVVDAMRSPARGLAGRLSIGGLAGLLARCAVVVGNDTGPLHLAAAVGAATAGVFWCGNLINAGAATRTRHRPSMSWVLDCPACGANCITNSCEHEDSFVVGVGVDEVLASALDLLHTAETDGRTAGDPAPG